MKGSYSLCLSNKRIRYELLLENSVTILNGKSSTGKSRFISLLRTSICEIIQRGISVANFATTFDDVYVVRESDCFDDIETDLKSMSGNCLVVSDEGTVFCEDIGRLKGLIQSTGFYFLLVTRTKGIESLESYLECELVTNRVEGVGLVTRLESKEKKING